MSTRMPGILRFEETYFERIWGGQKLRALFNKPIPEDRPIGEAWLIADHATCESRVAEGPLRGAALRELLTHDADAVLGARAQLTPHGRFPLLLKLLDASGVLSVQVHPDDETAKRLGEPDVGKTEMWHVLDAGPDSDIFCGLRPDVDTKRLAEAIRTGTLEPLLLRTRAAQDMSVFVQAGTMHAIGAGLVIAEIQQNSDLTYRCFDWNRVDAAGKPRELHIEKTLEATRTGITHAGPAKPLAYRSGGASIEVLGACRYFAAECISISDTFTRNTRGESFHILLAKSGPVTVRCGDDTKRLEPGSAALIIGSAPEFTLRGPGCILDYYVPDLARDVIEPLRAAGHPDEDIVRLGGPPETSGLAPFLC